MEATLPSSAAPAASATSAERERMYVFDNCKYILTQVVAWCHFTISFHHSQPVAMDAFMYREWFLMPVYTFISGYLSSPDMNTRRYHGTLKVGAIFVVNQVVVCLVLSTFHDALVTTPIYYYSVANMYDPSNVYSLFYHHSCGEPTWVQPNIWTEGYWAPAVCKHTWISDLNPFSLVSPWFHLWYLLCLFCWRLAAPVFSHLRFPFLFSLLLGVLNYNLGISMHMHKAIGYFPFYMLGVALKKNGIYTRLLQLASSRPRLDLLVRAAALGWLLLLFPFSVWAQKHLPGTQPVMWLLMWFLPPNFWKSKELPIGLTGSRFHNLLLLQLAIYGIICGSILAVMLLVPRKKHFFTAMGSRSLCNYIFHIYAVLAFEANFPSEHVYPDNRTSQQQWDAYVRSTLVAVITANVLMTRPFTTLLRPLLDPPIDLLLNVPLGGWWQARVQSTHACLNSLQSWRDTLCGGCGWFGGSTRTLLPNGGARSHNAAYDAEAGELYEYCSQSYCAHSAHAALVDAEH